MKNTISFFVMTKKGYKVLEYVIKNYLHTIDKVIVGKDNNLEKDYSSDIEGLCNNYNIKYYDYKDSFSITSLYSIAISWRWIIKDVNNLIVLHDSILPKYRGFSPLVNSLINAEKEIGVTALFASKNYDTGSIICQKKTNIDYPIKISNAIDKISYLYIDAINSVVKKINRGVKLHSYEQQESEATYSLWRSKDDYFINWNKDSNYIKRFIDAVGYPYDGAKTYVDKKEIIIKEAEVVDDLIIENRDVGKVVFFDNNFPIVVCNKGLIKITNAIYANSLKSIFPLNKFRIRFL